VRVPKYKELDLFAVFRDFDENEKGFLDIKEYADCLAQFEALGLTESERTYIALVADVRRNGKIDYSEVMKLFPRILVNMKNNSELQQMYIDETSYD